MFHYKCQDKKDKTELSVRKSEPKMMRDDPSNFRNCGATVICLAGLKDMNGSRK